MRFRGAEVQRNKGFRIDAQIFVKVLNFDKDELLQCMNKN
jgi:hypothetical protein